MNHSTGKPTKSEQARLDAIHDMPCLCCEREGVHQPNPTEAHHLTDKGTRKLSGGHARTLNLCGWHHRGVPRDGWYVSDMYVVYGPSLALSKRTFVKTYGTDRELLAKVDERLEARNAGAGNAFAVLRP